MTTLALILLLPLAGCGKSTSVPVASGPADLVRQAASAARDCGVTKLRVDALDEHTAMLRIDPKTPGGGVACTRAWVAGHAGLRPVSR